MGFWGDYLAALWHYWWTLVVVGVGAVFAFTWPFLPVSVHQLPAQWGWGVAYGGMIVAQALAARRVALASSTAAASRQSGATVPTPPPTVEASIVVTVDIPGIAPMSVTSAFRSGPPSENTITLSTATPDAGITGDIDDGEDDDQDGPIPDEPDQ